ncbi:hypothetical protein KAZ82_00080 [Candidatus Babeliales bacterium]|nr:hypothetical protein [Candidatus Babeliales bacterium]
MNKTSIISLFLISTLYHSYNFSSHHFSSNDTSKATSSSSDTNQPKKNHYPQFRAIKCTGLPDIPSGNQRSFEWQKQ